MAGYRGMILLAEEVLLTVKYLVNAKPLASNFCTLVDR